MNKLLIICGPTATGKTDLGIYLAKKFDGEIISADSRQVYKGLDIVTGKDIDKNSRFRNQNSELGMNNDKLSVGFREKDGIPIWLVDIVDIQYQFNAGEYGLTAQKVIGDIISRGKLPIIVGGTGMYIRSVIDPYATQNIPPNAKLRNRLEKYTRKQLAEYLKKINFQKWELMNTSDRLNPRRLIRAIEICTASKKAKLDIQKKTKQEEIDSLKIGLVAPFAFLYKRIDKRVEKRLQAGAIEEVERLMCRKLTSHVSVISSMGVKDLWEYLDGRITREQALQKWKFAEHAYARRQMTWFKKDKKIRWFDIQDKKYLTNINKSVSAWYTEG